MRLIASLIAGILLLSACGGSDLAQSVSATTLNTTPVTVATPAPPRPQSAPVSEPGEALLLSPLRNRVVELPSAIGIPTRSQSPLPIAISYDAIGVSAAPINPVGVEPNGEMQIPRADSVGWYQYGPTPGEPGSAVLAAHIAFDGERGVFRFLADSAENDMFTIDFADGSTVAYRVVERTQYDKDELPFDRVFAKDGPPVISLISCGGTFQRSISSYQDNIVTYAVPIA